MLAITPELVAEWEASHKQTKKLEDKITERIDYILKTWFEIYGAKIKYWYFNGAAEGEVGEIYMDENTIWNFYTEVNNFPDNDLVFIDRDGDEYGWQSEIPTRWLYDENFKEEIVKGKAEYERREAARKAKKKQNAADKKAKDEKLVADAKSKLSKEELAALRRSL